MKIGLFFGSFNPIHTGHLIIANYMVEYSDLSRVWLVVSPQSPFKKKKNLLNEYDRLHLVNLAIEGNDNLKASNVEFQMPTPSYTIDTLTHLKETYPQHHFVLLMGSDNLVTLPKWRNYEAILKYYQVYVYNRPEQPEGELFTHPHVRLFDAPMLQISATYIRDAVREGKSIKYLVPEKVEAYILHSNWFKE